MLFPCTPPVTTPLAKYLIAEQSGFSTDDLVKDVFANVRINGTQWVVQQVNVTVLIHCSRHGDTLFLSTA